MKTWNATGAVVGSKYLGKVQAETAEEALTKAQRIGHVSLCHQCSSECEDAEIAFVTVECSEETASDEKTWEDVARAAGWTPPCKAQMPPMEDM